MPKGPKFIIGTSPMVDRTQVYVTHNRTPRTIFTIEGQRVTGILWTEDPEYTRMDNLKKRLEGWLVALKIEEQKENRPDQ